MSSNNPPRTEHVLKGYRELVEVLSAAHSPEFPDPSVTMAQMRVLMLLGAVGEARMSDLAAKLGTSLSSLSSVVDRLVEADLARRREDARDRRSVLISLAPAGSALLDNFQELGERHLRELLDELSDEAITTVSQAIDLLVAAARRLAQKEPA
jgi:DNA-binding MarR family transcriptional regulator